MAVLGVRESSRVTGTAETLSASRIAAQRIAASSTVCGKEIVMASGRRGAKGCDAFL